MIAAVVNIFRSIPFLILIILLLGFTKILVGSILGPNAALPALIIGSAPFYARLAEIALREVDKGVIEAARSMGAKTSTIIFKVLIPESMPALISGITVTHRPDRIYRHCRRHRFRRTRKPCICRRLPVQ